MKIKVCSVNCFGLVEPKNKHQAFLTFHTLLFDPLLHLKDAAYDHLVALWKDLSSKSYFLQQGSVFLTIKQHSLG